MPKVSKTGQFLKTSKAWTTVTTKKEAARSRMDHDIITDNNSTITERMDTNNNDETNRKKGTKLMQQQQLLVELDRVLIAKQNRIQQLQQKSKSKNNQVQVDNDKTKTIDATTTNTNSTTTNDNNDNNNSMTILSKGQKKRQMKRLQYMKKENMILSSLQLRKMDEQKKRIDGLDAMKDALLATISNTSSTTNTTSNQPEIIKDNDGTKQKNNNNINLNRNNKNSQQLIQKELSHLQLVLQHPSFVKDPFLTIREHLTNTLSNNMKQQEMDAVKHTKDVEEQIQEKKEMKKEKILARKVIPTTAKGVRAANNIVSKNKKNKRFKATRSKSR